MRLIPFKNHINVETKFSIQHREDLADYAITLKEMLQIFTNQDVPVNILAIVFKKTLCGDQKPLMVKTHTLMKTAVI